MTMICEREVSSLGVLIDLKLYLMKNRNGRTGFGRSGFLSLRLYDLTIYHIIGRVDNPKSQIGYLFLVSSPSN